MLEQTVVLFRLLSLFRTDCSSQPFFSPLTQSREHLIVFYLSRVLPCSTGLNQRQRLVRSASSLQSPIQPRPLPSSSGFPFQYHVERSDLSLCLQVPSLLLCSSTRADRAISR